MCLYERARECARGLCLVVKLESEPLHLLSQLLNMLPRQQRTLACRLLDIYFILKSKPK